MKKAKTKVRATDEDESQTKYQPLGLLPPELLPLGLLPLGLLPPGLLPPSGRRSSGRGSLSRGSPGRGSSGRGWLGRGSLWDGFQSAYLGKPASGGDRLDRLEKEKRIVLILSSI